MDWDKVAAIAAIAAAVVGLLAAAAGGFSAWYAFSSADTAWRALQSSTVYQIQKDSIELARDYKEKKVGPGAVIAKLYSIYYQHRKGIIDEPLWQLLDYEYCRMMQEDKTVQDFWDKADKGLYGKDFTEYVSILRGGKKCG